jgi:PTH1 family peptidyl-tRNA hydrolase
MGFFLQKKDMTSEAMQYYTVGLNKTLLVVGLGNEGQKYENTRHNIGFQAVDTFAQDNDFDKWINKADLKCLFSSSKIGSARVILIKPTTMMNLSGAALTLVSNFYKIATSDILVIHDELDIKFGEIRTRMGGSSAGHNGVKSIIESLGEEDFGRIRIGIGPKSPATIDSADFVLSKFSKSEAEHLANITREVSSILNEYIFSDQPVRTETRQVL